MTFGVAINVTPMPNGTYDIRVYAGMGGVPCVLEHQEHATMYISILNALKPFLDENFRKMQRVPIPHSRSLVPSLPPQGACKPNA
ncbi:MAG: hypothetical protein ACTHJQ_08015 [Rhizobiaceae bacterium]